MNLSTNVESQQQESTPTNSNEGETKVIGEIEGRIDEEASSAQATGEGGSNAAKRDEGVNSRKEQIKVDPSTGETQILIPMTTKLMTYGVDRNLKGVDVAKLLLGMIEKHSGGSLKGHLNKKPAESQSALHFFASDAVFNEDGWSEEEAKLIIHRITKPPKMSWFWSQFLEKDSAAQFKKLLQGKKGKPTWKKAFDINERDIEKESSGGVGDENSRKKRDRNDDDNSNSANHGNSNGRDDDEEEGTTATKTRVDPHDPKSIRSSLTPYAHKSYSDQLVLKTIDMKRRCVLKIVKECRTAFKKKEMELKRNSKGNKTKGGKRNPNKDTSGNALDTITPEWLRRENSAELESLAPIHPILPSPVQSEYRNKCEFTFGHADAEKTQPVLGFTPNGWDGEVSPPLHCLNVPSCMVAIVDIFNEFIKSSPVPVYTQRLHKGCWRNVCIRVSEREGKAMIIIVHSPWGIGESSLGETWEKEKKRLVSLLVNGGNPIDVSSVESKRMKDREDVKLEVENDSKIVREQKRAKQAEREKNNNDWVPPETVKDSSGDDDLQQIKQADLEPNNPKGIVVTSIHFQEFSGLSIPPPEHPTQHAYGTTYLEERLGMCTFRVSPGAFFQVNTMGAEVLYSKIVEVVRGIRKEGRKLVMFDVCCGTGTIGLTCMKENVVDRVIGIDISEPAIGNAIVNAKLNGFGVEGTDKDATTKWIASKAEEAMKDEIFKLRGEQMSTGNSFDIIAVCDPARDGLHVDVIRALRRCAPLAKIVYVSCNPTKSLVRDCTLLCGPQTNNLRGEGFWMEGAWPCDMFPQTDHCEMIMLLGRKGGFEKESRNGSNNNNNGNAKQSNASNKAEKRKRSRSVDG